MYKFMLVFLLSVGQISGECVIPQSWIDRGYTYVDMNFGGNGIIVLVELTAASLNVHAWNLAFSSIGSVASTCVDSLEDGDKLKVAWDGTNPIRKYCDTITPGDNDKALMYQENYGDTTMAIADCQAPYDQFRLGIPAVPSPPDTSFIPDDIFASFQTLASGTTTSLSQEGTFQVEVTDDSGTYCQGDETSTIDISGNQLILNSCQATYNLQLTWIESFTPDDSATNGFIALLMDLTTSPSYKLYCARFIEEGSSVTMSVEIGDTDEAICPGTMTPDFVDANTFSFTYTFPTTTTTTAPTTTVNPFQSSGAVISPPFLLFIICGLLWMALYS